MTILKTKPSLIKSTNQNILNYDNKKQSELTILKQAQENHILLEIMILLGRTPNTGY